MKHFDRVLRGTGCSFFLAALLALLIPNLASAEEGDGVKITSIEVQYTGPQTVSRERILAQMRTKVGQTYSPGIAEQDIRALYDTGQVQNVRIFGQEDNGGVKVTVAIQTRAMMSEIEIQGASVISAKALRKKIKLKVNQPIDETVLGAAKQDIIEAYRAKGFNEIDVDYRIDTNAERGTSRAIFTVNEGVKGSIARVEFPGSKSFGDRALRKQMKTRPKTIISFLDKTGRLEEPQLQQDLDSLREFYQNKGYVDVEVGPVRKERVKGRTVLVIPIVEGQKYTVGKIRVKGQKVTSGEKILNLMKVKEGGVYSPKGIREDAKTIADAYGSGGYVDLVVSPQGIPSGPGQIDVTYTIEEGSRSFVQRINIIGNTRTKDKVIRREVLIAPGDIYSTTRVETSKKRLDNLGYFARVETYPEDTGVPGRKDLTVQVEEKRTGSLNFGAGFSTVDDILGFVELTQGNFDLLNWPNFTGGGQKFRARLQLGTSRKDVIVSLTEPYFLDRQLSVGGQVFYSEANFLSNVYDQRNYGFSVNARRGIGRFMSAAIEYKLESVQIFNISSGVSQNIRDAEGTDLKSVVTTTLIYDTRDNPFLTHKGSRVVLTPYVAGGFLGGDVQIFGFDLEGSQYYHLPYDLILLFNGEFANVDTWGDGNRVPIYDRLYLGGANNLRGFDYRDVGPKDQFGEPLGGRMLARATIELTFPIIEKVRAAVFYDVGVVGLKAFEANGRAASDVGLGVRLDLPIGPLRLDYGIPVTTGGNNSGKGKFNFNVGYQF